MFTLLTEIALTGSVLFICSIGLHYLAFKRGVLDRDSIHADVDDALNEDWENNWKDSGSERNPMLKKWLEFGGGYYGTVAFVKLIFIEFGQFIEFVKGWQGLEAFLPDSKGGWINTLIDLVVSFFVNQIQNFVEAISWPAYYLSNFSILHCGIFVSATYGLFYVSQRVAWQRYSDKYE